MSIRYTHMFIYSKGMSVVFSISCHITASNPSQPTKGPFWYLILCLFPQIWT